MIRQIGDIIAYSAVISAFLLMLSVGIESIVKYIEDGREYRAARSEIKYEIRVWTSIAKSCDPIQEAFEKGYAIAQIVVLNHELEELEENRKRELCS